jgi:hypothetical protein
MPMQQIQVFLELVLLILVQLELLVQLKLLMFLL